MKEIMGKVIDAKSAIDYAYQNAKFAVFCYENQVLGDLLLESWFLKQLVEKEIHTKIFPGMQHGG